MKKLIVLGVIILAGVAAYIFSPSLESIVQKLVHKYASQVTGTEVNLSGFKLSLTKGEASLSGLTVANPENYQSPYILNLGNISAKVDVKSLASDTIIIDEILVDKPIITYEMLSITQNNIKQLQENIAKNTASAEKTEQEDNSQAAQTEDEKYSQGKKVIIKLVRVSGAELQAIAPLQGTENAVKLDIPTIEIKGIGENKKGGDSIVSSISTILNKILSDASKTAVKAQLGDLKNVAQENMNNVVDGVKDKVKNLGIFNK